MINEGFWSGNEGSSRVDNTLVTIAWDCGVTLLDSSKVEGPVGLFDNIVFCDFLEFAVCVRTWNSHVRCVWVVVEVETEGVLREVALIDEDWEVVDGDGWVSKSENTIELRNKEHSARGAGNLSKGHCSGNGVSHGYGIL